MSGILRADEIAFLKKMEEQRNKHKEAQAKYRANNKDEIKTYNQKYNQDNNMKNELKNFIEKFY